MGSKTGDEGHLILYLRSPLSSLGKFRILSVRLAGVRHAV